MRYYELTYLISPELSEEKVNALRERIIAYLQEKGGLLSEPGGLIKKILGYPIRKKKNAFLATLNFSASTEILDGLKKILDGETEILRYFIINKKGATKAVTPPLPEKYKSFASLPSVDSQLNKNGGVGMKKPTVHTQPKEPKVELEEIEKKLDEILGQ